MSNYKSTVTNLRPYKAQHLNAPILRKERSASNRLSQTFDDYEEDEKYHKHNNSFGEGRENFRYRYKLLGKPNGSSKAILKTDEPPQHNIQQYSQPTIQISQPEESRQLNDGVWTQVQKMEMLNNLLMEKIKVYEQTIDKLKQENGILKKTIYKVVDNQELELGGWKEQFKEALRSVAPKEDAKRELKRHENKKWKTQDIVSDTGNDSSSTRAPMSASVKKRLGKLESQNDILLQKLGRIEGVVQRKTVEQVSKPRVYYQKDPYEDSDFDEHSQSLKKILNQAVGKLKAIEYELETFEQKNDYLEHELVSQKKARAFNENNFAKIANNQSKLLEESLKLQKQYQSIIRGMNKAQHSAYLYNHY